MIDLTIHPEGLAHNIQKARENNIIIPTIAQMQNPDLIPEKIKDKLAKTDLWAVDPVNLFRISWHNEAKESGGLFQKVKTLPRCMRPDGVGAKRPTICPCEYAMHRIIPFERNKP